MLKAFLADLQQYADPAVAEGQKNYHKVERIYLGARVPQVTRVARQAVSTLTEDQLLDLCDQLWQTNIHEAMVAVGKILERKEIRNTRAIWTLIDRIKEDLDSWAIADHLAHAAFRCLEDHPSLLDEIEKSWLHHPSFWVRRASLGETPAGEVPGDQLDAVALQEVQPVAQPRPLVGGQGRHDRR